MEEQPIDDLFARKLRDMEVMPGADTLSRLQSRMNTVPLPQASPKRQLAGWWYGVRAASILLVIFWISWSTQTRVDTKVNGSLAKSDSHPKAKQVVEPMLTQTEPDQLPTPVGTPDKGVSQVSKRKNLPIAENQLAQSKRSNTVQRLPELPATKINTSSDTPDSPPTREVILAQVEPAAPKADERAFTGRTVVMTIAEAEPVQLASMQPQKADPAANASNLSQLLEKVRQFKQGETFARASPSVPPTESKTSLKRFVNGVRESLRNENTLEL